LRCSSEIRRARQNFKTKANEQPASTSTCLRVFGWVTIIFESLCKGRATKREPKYLQVASKGRLLDGKRFGRKSSETRARRGAEMGRVASRTTASKSRISNLVDFPKDSTGSLRSVFESTRGKNSRRSSRRRASSAGMKKLKVELANRLPPSTFHLLLLSPLSLPPQDEDQNLLPRRQDLEWNYDACVHL